ncbi:hypothetical protein C8R45DRAFT_1113733 [Mycena sanguinolenta]|nr:hypothetical protein C8R45DRAFT_1113733 [Mycena sanguinolenta]
MTSRQLLNLIAAALNNPNTAFDAARYRQDDKLMADVALSDGILWAAMEQKLRRETVMPIFRSVGVTYSKNAPCPNGITIHKLPPELHAFLDWTSATCAALEHPAQAFIGVRDGKLFSRFLKLATVYTKIGDEEVSDYYANYGVFETIYYAHPSRPVRIAVHRCWEEPCVTVLRSLLTCLMNWMDGKSFFIAYSDLTLNAVTMVSHITTTLSFLVLEQPTSDVSDVKSFLSPPMFIATGRVKVEDYVALLDQYFDFGANGLRVPDTEVQEYYDEYCRHISRPASVTKESNTSNEISCNLRSALSPHPSKD